MATVDARGFSCPVPLLMVQEEIKKSDPAELEAYQCPMRRGKHPALCLSQRLHVPG